MVDRLEISEGYRYFDGPSGWLVGQAVGLLNARDEVVAAGYRRVVELLGERGDTVSSVKEILDRVPAEDVPLRWSLLYVLADVGDPRAIPLFEEVASAAVAQRDEERSACESTWDGEVLVRTMAIEALGRFVSTGQEADTAVRALVGVLGSQRETALRVEAVKALGERAYVSAGVLLGDDERWMLDLKTVRFEELAVDVERAEVADRRSSVPLLTDRRTAPAAHPDGER